jgi:hypothetical protein
MPSSRIVVSQGIKLSPEQIQTLKHHSEDFKIWLDSDKGKQDIHEHNEHVYYFKEKLSRQNLDIMTEDDKTGIRKAIVRVG